ncbi:tumor necrosis factor receptor superfamily member 11B-like isoform X2 [Rhinichthys klamathensis goyatoka]|uniref:tumor necrosis factor receptor superfamily member 11B-like isoform X2 n=1 Tax=Rhinichthys klamathensis goyatoka TaxID=3034132 RepID=UPI0024B62C40|nr:tumor necrosis factor receptor superfamily member 11B-like isoform X2 [Rhinichthys klamathensis goyatoka]
MTLSQTISVETILSVRTSARLMSVLNMPPLTAVKLQMLFAMSFAWAYQEIPKYQHRDPLTSKVLLCEQCPPGMAVGRHCRMEEPTICVPCPEKHFAEQWHWGDSCQHCTSVCKERQIVQRECNSTHDRLCECIPGYHLVVEFCVHHTACLPGSGVAVQGTPERNTVCEKCPQGYFSSTSSSTEPCMPHRDCTQLGLKTVRLGTTTQDTLCESENKEFTFDCSHQHTECHTDVNHCERKVSRCASVKNLTLEDLLLLMDSLPGEKVSDKDVRALVHSCPSQRYIIQLLHLWKIQNGGQDLAKALSHSLRKLRSKGARRPLLKILKRISRIISVSSIHRMYEKMIINMIQDNTCFKTKLYND